MATPTIQSVSPTTIFTGGQMFTITGTNFRTSYPAPDVSTGPLPPALPTMQVFVGSKQATNVRVLSSTQLTAKIGPLDPISYAITIKNLDQNGAPIAGETATASNILSAKRADLAYDTDFTRLERTLIIELRRQVIANTVKTVAVDYDGTPLAVPDSVDIANLPSLTLQGPQVVEDRFYDLNVSLITPLGDDQFEQRNTFSTVNLTYRFVGMDNLQGRNMNLFTLMLQFLQNNPHLEMARDVNDPTKGSVRYEMSMLGEFTTFTGSSESDIRGFSGSLVIRGFQVEDVTGFPEQTVAERGGTVDNVNVPPVGVFSGS